VTYDGGAHNGAHEITEYTQNPFEVSLGLKPDMTMHEWDYHNPIQPCTNPIQIFTRLSQPHL
jgi:hypothetical protein